MPLFFTRRNAETQIPMAAPSFATHNRFALSPFLLSSFHLLIGRQKKAVDGHEGGGDHENLVNGESEVQKTFLM